MKEPYYDIISMCMLVSENQHFHLHCHEQYEILLFLEGDAKYIVEEKSYTLEPCDLIVIRKHEMHRIYHNRPTRYQHIVLMVSPDFF